MKENGTRMAHHSSDAKKKMVNRMRRIEGQIRGITGMIEENVYCDEILHQFLAVEAAINGVKMTLLEEHMKSCVVDQIQEGNLEVIDELMTTVRKMTR